MFAEPTKKSISKKGLVTFQSISPCVRSSPKYWSFWGLGFLGFLRFSVFLFFLSEV